jgi:hypothetical protein
MFPARVGLQLSRGCPSRKVQIPTRISTFSTWKYPDLPRWPQDSPKEKPLPKEDPIITKKKAKLEKSVKDAARAHLIKHHSDAFSRTNKVLVSPPLNKKQSTNSTIQTLAALNGYEIVPTPKPNDSVSLAEGILALPNFHSRYYNRSGHSNLFVLLAKPMDPTAAKTKHYPKIVQEDIHLYRILFNTTENFINARYNSLRNWFQTLIERPLVSLLERLQNLRAVPDEPTEVQSQRTVIEKPTNLPATSAEVALQSVIDIPENLLVIGNNEMVLISNMTPSVRLLALPYTLQHKSASTLISVSLVVFGALPLAYRSLNFALSYPGLSEVIAASVVGTASYTLWSSRSYARTSQSQVISDAILHRIYARDEAVVLVLQEGAVHRVAQAVLSLYYHHKRPVGIERNQVLATPKTSVIDPLKLAVEFGLMEDTKDGNHKDWVAVSLDEACARVESRTTGSK